jgi:NAD+ kinase
MASKFKLIGILGKIKSPHMVETLKALIEYLRSLKQPFLLDAEIEAILNDASQNYASREELSKRCNLFIVVGGDGSLLHAAHLAASLEIPIVGINRGRLGFLTDILPTELDKIGAILNGEYILEKRFLLTARVFYNGESLGQSDALNEVALIPDSQPHMNEFEIYIDDQFVLSQDSDGLIVATPTGSTAYALSGGGPILHPQLDAIVLVPMFPHTLSIRPIVIEGERRITIVIAKENSATPRLTCDGQAFINTPPGSHIEIMKKEKRLHLIHPIDYDYYETLRSKLHWGRKLNYSE